MRLQVVPALLAAATAGAMIALYAFGHQFFVTQTVLFPILLLTGWVSGGLRRWAVDWLPFLAWLGLFDVLRGMAYAFVKHFNRPIFELYAVHADRVLLGGRVGPEVLQQAFYSGHIGFFEKLNSGIYASHFLGFALFGMAVWLFRRDSFSRYCRVMLAISYAGLLGYFLVPTAPPWIAAIHKFVQVTPISQSVYNTAIPSVAAMFDINPVAAMPSLHCAFPMAFLLVARNIWGRRAWPVALYAFAVAFSTVYLGQHYVVDVIAGWVLAFAVYCIFFHARIGDRIASRIVLSIPAGVRQACPHPMVSLPVFAISVLAGVATMALR